MKKRYIISIIILLILSFVLFFLIHFSKASILSTEGYFVTNDKIDDVLLSDKKVLKSKNISLEKVSYKDEFYSNMGKLYVGEDDRTYVNDNYPIISRDGLSIVNISDEAKFINDAFDIYDGYENATLTDGKLYNYGDLVQADYEDYIFVELANGTYVNLHEITIQTIVNTFKIPVNSIMVFYESYIKYYFFNSDGLLIYDIIDGLDHGTTIKMGDNNYSYYDLLVLFSVIEPKGGFDEDEVGDSSESDNALGNPSIGTPEFVYVKPEVEVLEKFKANVYSATAKIRISDPSGVIVGGVNFQFKIGEKIFSRRAFVQSGVIKVTGLVPNTKFTIIGSYKYYSKDKKKMENVFFEQEIETLSADKLEPIDLYFVNGKIHSNKIELNEFKINSSLENEAISGVSKGIITINGKEYTISRSLLLQMAMGKSITYMSPNNIQSNSEVNYEIKFLDAFDNEIKVTNNKGSTRTSKQAPSIVLKRTSDNINSSSFSVKVSNEDDVKISSFRYVLYDAQMNLIETGDLEDLDSQEIIFDNLNPSSLYHLKIFGDYDVEDGLGVVKDNLMGDVSFTTLSLSSLGVIKLSSGIDSLSSNSVVLKSIIDFEHTSSLLLSLLNSFSIIITDEDGVEWFRKEYTSGAEIAEVLAGEFFTNVNNLYSQTNTYYVDFLATVKQGTTIESVEVDCPFDEFKLLKNDAQVNITNFFSTRDMIVFDLEVIDIENAISEDFVTLRVLDEDNVYIDVLKVTKNQQPITLKYDSLDFGNTGTFKFNFIAAGYNIGYDSTHFESNKELIEGGVQLSLDQNVYGTLQMSGLHKVIDKKNYFNLADDEKFRNDGVSGSKSFNIAKNVLTLGAKNGVGNISYYAPDIVGKYVNVSFWAKYSDSAVSTRPIYFAKSYSASITSKNLLVGLNQDKYVKYSFTFLANSPYVGFIIEELKGLNQTTYVDIKDLMITTELSYKSKALNYTNYAFTDISEEVNTREFAYASIKIKSRPVKGTSNGAEFTLAGLNEFSVTKSGNYDVIVCGNTGGMCTKGTIALTAGDKMYFYLNTGTNGDSDLRIIGGSDISFDNAISRASIIMLAKGKNSSSKTYISNDNKSSTYETAEPYLKYEQYSEEEKFNGQFKINIGYQANANHSLELDGKYYVSQCNNVSCEYDGGTNITNISDKLYEKLFEKNKEFTLNLSFKGTNGRHYVLDTINFSTVSQIYGIDDPRDFSSLHSDGRYVVLNDLDFSQYNGSFSGTFYGDIDFQGYKIIASLKNMNSYIINKLADGSTIRNVVIDYDLNNPVEGVFYGIVYENAGFIDNVYINVNSSSYASLNTSSLISASNSGTIQNFVINNNTNIVTEYGFGLVSYANSGKIKNGYVFGNDIDATIVRDSIHTEGKAVGGVVGINRANGVISNIYSLLAVKRDSSIAAENQVGNIVGYNQGNINNVYSVEDSSKYSEGNPNPNTLDKDPNIGVYKSGVIKDVYYVSDNNYSNSKSLKLVKSGLYESKLQEQLLNSEKAFEITRYLNVGCFPQVKLSNYMPRQQLIFLPIMTEADRITIISNQQLVSEANMAVFKLQLNNASQQDISSITIDNISSSKCTEKKTIVVNGEEISICDVSDGNKPQADKVWILSQNNYDDVKSEIVVQIYKTYENKVPTEFKSQLLVNSIIAQLNGTNVSYAIEKSIDISLYYPIYSKSDWKMINSYLSGNFMLMTDLDFSSSNNSAACTNLDRTKYCCKNATSGNCELIFGSSALTCQENAECYENLHEYRIGGTFTGKLDGGGHTISNLRIKRNDSISCFFDVIKGGTLQNLYVENYQKVNMGVSSSGNPGHYGGFIRSISNGAVIDNVHIKNAEIYGDRYSGGLVGSTSGGVTISNSSVSNVKLFNRGAGGYFLKEMGGLVGRGRELTVKNSYVDNLEIDLETLGLSTAGVGGLVGTLDDGSITNSYATGTIRTGTSIIGGIVGRLFDGASVNNVWSGVNIYSTMDYVGGIVGRRENDKISNTLVVGEINSTYSTNTVNRTIGNTLSVGHNNFAWNGQKFNGLVSASGSVEEPLSVDDLRRVDTYSTKMNFDNNFSFDAIAEGTDVAVLPLLKHSKTGEILNSNKPGFEQEKVKLKYDTLNVLSVKAAVDVDPTYNTIRAGSTITITVEDVNNILSDDDSGKNKIENIKFDYIEPGEGGYQITVGVIPGTGQKNIVISNFKFSRAYDAYLLEKMYIKDGPVLDLNVKVDYIYYNYINNLNDWYTYLDPRLPNTKRLNAENFKISSSLSELDILHNENNYVYALVIGRLEYDGPGSDGTDGRVILDFGNNPYYNRTSLFRTITKSLKNIQFENINFESDSTGNYQGFIRLAYGTVDNVAFKNTRITAKNGLITACFGGFFGESMTNVHVLAGDQGVKSGLNDKPENYSNSFISKYYTGGIIGYKYSFSDVSNLSVSDTYVQSTTGEYTGGIIGVTEDGNSNAFNLRVSDSYITGTSYVGGLVGRGSARGYKNNGVITSSSVTNTTVVGSSTYVGGAVGYSVHDNLEYVNVNNVKVLASGSDNVGGLAGRSIGVSNSFVNNTDIYGRGNVGGLVGYGSGGINTCGVSDTNIRQYGSNIGGIVGYLQYQPLITKTYATNVHIDDVGAVQGASCNVGGILGYSDGGAKLSVVTANVHIATSGSDVGGVIGQIAHVIPNENQSSYAREIILADSSITIQGEDENIPSNRIGLFVGKSARSLFENKFSKIVLDGQINKKVNSGYVNFVQGLYTNSYLEDRMTVFVSADSNIVSSDGTKDSVSVDDFGNNHEVILVPKADFKIRQFYKNSTYTSSDGTTRSGLASSNFYTIWNDNKESVADGYFAKVTATQPNVRIPETAAVLKVMSSSVFHRLPEMKVYASDVDKLNIDFSTIDEDTYFEIYENDNKIFGSDILKRTYTISYNYKNNIKVIMKDKNQTVTEEYKATDFINEVGVYDDKYVYIYENKLRGNVSTPKDKFIHIFGKYALTEDGGVYDYVNEKFIMMNDDLKSELLTESKVVYSFSYKNANIDTFGTYSIIHKQTEDIYFDNPIYVKNDVLEIVDSSLDVNFNSIIVDEYAKDNYVTLLGNDGVIYNLKENIKVPTDFINKNITYMSNNIYAKDSVVVVKYKNDKVIVFDYRTGKVVKERKANDNISIVDYFREAFTTQNASIDKNLSKKYIDAVDLKSKIEEMPIVVEEGKYSITDEETDKDDKNNGLSSKNDYVVYYNSLKGKYDVLNIGEVIDNKNTDMEIVVENDKIYSSAHLVEFYSGKSILERVFGTVNIFLILFIILLSIICSIIIWFANVRIVKEHKV